MTPALVPRPRRRGPCQRFARNWATRNLTPPTTRPSLAPLTCAVAWVGEVLHGLVNDRRIDGKEGVAGSIPAGGSTPMLTSGNADQLSSEEPLGRSPLVGVPLPGRWTCVQRKESTSLVSRSGHLRASYGLERSCPWLLTLRSVEGCHHRGHRRTAPAGGRREPFAPARRHIGLRCQAGNQAEVDEKAGPDDDAAAVGAPHRSCCATVRYTPAAMVVGSLRCCCQIDQF